MKLNRNNRISYDGFVYAVVAVIWGTVYLQKTDNECDDYDYTMQDVYRYYKDIEIIEGQISDKLGKHMYAWTLPKGRG